MMAVLVFAFNLSEVIDKRQKRYDRLSIDLPGPFEDVLRLFGPDIPSLNDVIQGPEDACERYIDMHCSNLPQKAGEVVPVGGISDATRECLWGLGAAGADGDDIDDYLSSACQTSLKYYTPPSPVDDAAVDDDLWREDDDADVSGNTAVNSVFELRRSLNRYLRSPLPTPTFDQYFGTSLALSSAFDDATYNELLNNNEYGREWGNLFTLGTVHIAPAGQLANDLVDWLTNNTLTFSNLTHRVHDSVAGGIDYINDNLDERAFALIDLQSHNLDPADVAFTIRMNYTTLPNTGRVTNFVALGLDKKYQRYYLSGFLTLQRTLAEFVMDTNCDADIFPTTSDLFAMPMPTPKYSQNVFYTAVGYLLGLAISMGFLYPMSRLVKSVVEEKESRMKETMLILGVSDTVLWLSWVFTAYTTFTIISVLVTWCIHKSFLPSSSVVLLFMYIWLFCAAVIGYSFFIASFFSKAKLAAIVGPVALFASLMPRWIFYGTNRYEAEQSKVWASFLPCTAFAFGADILSDYEYAEVGIQMFNINDGAYSFNTCLSMMAFDAMFYFFLAWYCNQVIPSEFGVAKHPLFLCFPSFWKDVFATTLHAESYSTLDSLDTGADAPPPGDPDNYEPVDPTFHAQVLISNLTKHYSGAPVPSVDDMSLTMYEDQIMCLLGHNGAGKTTTISVLTGLYPATSGECTIYGKKISTSLSAVRASCGICPQHNVLFPELTVAEHIVFFNAIKGATCTADAVSKAAQDVGLGDKLSALSATLSGGMKRKLSVCIALCGNPKFLLLDEPTSGMDPYSRRATWELLRKSKKNRVTLLTTHFMDEAGKP
jgi:ABC-type Na+ transport system ATPase subunit NatA